MVNLSKSKNWEKWEECCTDFLNNKFGTYAKFTLKGGSNSKVSDIFVETKSGNSFYVEVKASSAQCGQFVLKTDDKTKSFIYSIDNETNINDQSEKIIQYMNKHFDTFRDPGRRGIDIDMPNGSDIFKKWVTEYYKSKGVKFFISGHKETGNFIIFPIDDFSKHFDIKATYRIKKSGSSTVPKSHFKSVRKFLLSSNNYEITDLYMDGKKLFATSKKDLDKKIFKTPDFKYDYRFSYKDASKYEIRKLSNTNNENIIFSIHLIDSVPGISDTNFTNCLMSCDK